MIDGDALRMAVASALKLEAADVQLVEGSVVAAGGEGWLVRSSSLDGTAVSTCPDILIVSSLRSDDPGSAVWVAELPGRGFARLEDEGVLAELFATCPDLPGETIARLVAVTCGPKGAEAALTRGDEIDALLGPLASALASADRRLQLDRQDGGAWEITFPGSLMRRSNGDGSLLVTISRWQARFQAGELEVERREIVSDALFPPR